MLRNWLRNHVYVALGDAPNGRPHEWRFAFYLYSPRSRWQFSFIWWEGEERPRCVGQPYRVIWLSKPNSLRKPV